MRIWHIRCVKWVVIVVSCDAGKSRGDAKFKLNSEAKILELDATGPWMRRDSLLKPQLSLDSDRSPDSPPIWPPLYFGYAARAPLESLHTFPAEHGQSVALSHAHFTLPSPWPLPTFP